MNFSPLRYPGGKSRITKTIETILTKIDNNNKITYIEPFAGGAGIAINLLLAEKVEKIVINDYDKAVYSFWRAIKEKPESFIKLIYDVPINIDEWYRQKRIYTENNKKYSLQLGFAAFYLNRTNRSGILNAGPIGGYSQNGNYKMNVRFNKQLLIEKIKNISLKKKNIYIYNKEVRSFIVNVLPKFGNRSFVYLDPPYFNNGQRLYQNFFTLEDHKQIAQYICQNIHCPWIITYDDVPEIKMIYSNYEQRTFQLNYSAANKGNGTEIMIFKSRNLIPDQWL